MHTMFVHLFTGIETRCQEELTIIRQQYPDGRDPPRFSTTPTVVHWEQAMQMLTDAGEEAPALDDLTLTPTPTPTLALTPTPTLTLTLTRRRASATSTRSRSAPSAS